MKDTYKLTNQSGEHYLTVVGTDVFYHGKVRGISSSTEETSNVYFLSKAVTEDYNKDGIIDRLRFYDFQYADAELKVTDFKHSKCLTNKAIQLSFDIYNSMQGNILGDTLSFKATKHLHDSQTDTITFLKLP
jgi:hypothetical protein